MLTSTLGKLQKLQGTNVARGAVLAAAAAVGVSAGALAADDPAGDPPTEPAEATRTRVAFAVCPGGAPTGAFHGGDRVLATGRSDDGAWIEVRAPEEADGRVAWVPAAAVEPDASFGHLPTSGCEVVDPVDERTDDAPKGPTPTTTTTLPAPPPIEDDRSATERDTSEPAAEDPIADDDTKGSGGDTGDDAGDGDGDGTSEQPADGVDNGDGDEPDDNDSDSADDESADESEPEIGAVAADPGAIWEDGPVCDGKPRTATVSAEITDDTDVASARLVWSVADEHGEIAMEGSGTTWSATVGPFAEDTIPYATSEPVALTVEASDEAGNTSSARAGESTLELHDCTFG